jgi:Ni/Co efflux regulator RcnB
LANTGARGGVSVERETKMRTLMIASAGVALMAASGASAEQRVVTRGPGVAPQMAPMRAGTWHGNGAPRVQMGGSRWGSKVGGHWWGGMNAPGGWQAYRRPARGYVLPSYWISPRFYINDWSGYGLSQPINGYNWVRYYDDAVLIDGRGSVYDVAEGIDWDRYDNGYYTDDTSVYAGPTDRGYYANGDDVPVAPDYGARYDDRQRRDGNGVTGALVGGALGGVAGNVIAGRGNRLGGTLIGEGVGAAAGYAVGGAGSDRRNYAPPPAPQPGYAPPPPPPPPAPRYGYRDDYAARGYDRGYGYDHDHGYHGAPYPMRAAPGTVVTNNGGTVVTTTQTGGYAAGGYYYPAGSTTTVVVQSAPVVTTTTTEIYEDTVTYTKKRPARRTKLVKRWRKPVKCSCR